MTSLLAYLLIIAGVATSAVGYAKASPGSVKDEANQVFWQAFGPYVILIGAVVSICGLLLVRVAGSVS